MLFRTSYNNNFDIDCPGGGLEKLLYRILCAVIIILTCVTNMYAFMQVFAVYIIRRYININGCLSQDQLVKVCM